MGCRMMAHCTKFPSYFAQPASSSHSKSEFMLEYFHQWLCIQNHHTEPSPQPIKFILCPSLSCCLCPSSPPWDCCLEQHNASLCRPVAWPKRRLMNLGWCQGGGRPNAGTVVRTGPEEASRNAA